MRILMVVAGAIRPMHGGGTRSYHLLRELAQHHQVSALALLAQGERIPFTGEEIAGFSQVVRIVEVAGGAKRARQVASVLRRQSYRLSAGSPPVAQQALDRLIAEQGIETLLFETALTAGYRWPAALPSVIDQQNIEYELALREASATKSWLRRRYGALESSALRRGELARCQRADALTVCSERERDALQAELPGKPIFVAPNGVDTAAFAPTDPSREVAGRVIFTGTMHYHPNVDAATYFADACWERIRAQTPAATWQVVGAGAPPAVTALERLPGVAVTGWVPEMAPYLAEAQVVVAPLRVGGGTRLKILEALAAGKALVTTTVGCEGIGVTPGEHAIVADDPDAFADAVVALLRDPARRQALGAAGRALVQEQFSWGASARQLMRAIDVAAEASRAALAEARAS